MEKNKWMFPVRIEGSTGIVWKDNIVEALGRMKKPIDETTWYKLLDKGIIAAETPEQQELLRQWWQYGWQETPQLPHKNSTSIPVLQIQESALGPTLHTVFGNSAMAAKELKVDRDVVLRISDGKPRANFNNFAYKLLRHHNKGSIVNAQERKQLWTHFAANNIILGSYPTKQAMANAIGVTGHIIDVAHKKNWNELPDGTWVWCDDWGIMPISPQDEPLGMKWRQKYASPNCP